MHATVCLCALSLLLAACAPRPGVHQNLLSPGAPAPADLEQAPTTLDEAGPVLLLREARWHLLRASEARQCGQPALAQNELDQALQQLSSLEADAEHDSTAVAVATQIENEYRLLLPHLERLSSTSPLLLLLEGLSEEELQDLDAESALLLRLHQISRYCDVPVDAHPRVAASIDFFQTRGRATITGWLQRAGRYRPMILQTLRAEGVPEDLLHVAMIESGFNPNAYSPAHAAGMWQFIQETGQREGLHRTHWLDERRDPPKATRAAARHLRGLYADLQDWRLALAAYNCGQKRVEKAIERAGTRDFWALDLPAETMNYVPLFMAATAIDRDPRLFGFDPPEPEPPLEYDEVPLPAGTPYVDLRVAADVLGVSYSQLRQLNPELRQRITPPDCGPQGYKLRVPTGTGGRLLERYAALPAASRPKLYEYVVQRRDNLARIAQQFGVDSNLIAETNEITSQNPLRAGQRLLIPTTSGSPVETAQAKVTYVVRTGESLASIAQRHGVGVRDLKQWNRLASNRIHPGDRLTIWRSGRHATPAAAGPAVAAQPAERETLAAAKAAPATVRRHTVAAGETLWELARRYGVTVSQLKQWNRISGNALQRGQVLAVSAATARAKPQLYTVVKGDTLSRIARKFGLDVDDLARHNNMKPSATLMAGTKLHLVPPAATVTAD